MIFHQSYSYLLIEVAHSIILWWKYYYYITWYGFMPQMYWDLGIVRWWYQVVGPFYLTIYLRLTSLPIIINILQFFEDFGIIFSYDYLIDFFSWTTFFQYLKVVIFILLNWLYIFTEYIINLFITFSILCALFTYISYFVNIVLIIFYDIYFFFYPLALVSWFGTRGNFFELIYILPMQMRRFWIDSVYDYMNISHRHIVKHFGPATLWSSNRLEFDLDFLSIRRRIPILLNNRSFLDIWWSLTDPRIKQFHYFDFNEEIGTFARLHVLARFNKEDNIVKLGYLGSRRYERYHDWIWDRCPRYPKLLNHMRPSMRLLHNWSSYYFAYKYLFYVSVGQSLIFHDIFYIIVIFYILNTILKFGDPVAANAANYDYLWLKLREDARKPNQQEHWLENEETIEILNFFTDKLIDFSTLEDVDPYSQKHSHDSLRRKKLTPEDYKNRRELENILKNEINLDHIQSKRAKKGQLRSTSKLDWNVWELFQNQRYIWNKLKVQNLNNDFDEQIINNFDDIVNFDYQHYLFDPRYSSYYHLFKDEYLKLTLFQARGFRRNSIMKQLHMQGEVDFSAADLAYQEDNEELLF